MNVASGIEHHPPSPSIGAQLPDRACRRMPITAASRRCGRKWLRTVAPRGVNQVSDVAAILRGPRRVAMRRALLLGRPDSVPESLHAAPSRADLWTAQLAWCDRRCSRKGSTACRLRQAGEPSPAPRGCPGVVLPSPDCINSASLDVPEARPGHPRFGPRRRPLRGQRPVPPYLSSHCSPACSFWRTVRDPRASARTLAGWVPLTGTVPGRPESAVVPSHCQPDPGAFRSRVECRCPSTPDFKTDSRVNRSTLLWEPT